MDNMFRCVPGNHDAFKQRRLLTPTIQRTVTYIDEGTGDVIGSGHETVREVAHCKEHPTAKPRVVLSRKLVYETRKLKEAEADAADDEQ